MQRKDISAELFAMAQKYAPNPFNVSNYCKTAHKKRNVSFEKPKNRLRRLQKNFDSDPNLSSYSQYIGTIIADYDSLNCLTPSEVATVKGNFDNILAERLLNTKFKIKNDQATKNKKGKAFYKLIVEAMRYEALRNVEFLVVCRELGIKSCVYCNAQLTVVIEKKKGVNKGVFQLDHAYPKSKYPFLSTSFFNFYLCCGVCNIAKLDNEADFKLYTEQGSGDDLSPFEFKLEKANFARYLNARNMDEHDMLEIKLIPSNSCNDAICKQHNEMFCIEAI